MSNRQRAIRTARHESPSLAWESVFGAPEQRLRGHLLGDYHGWTERTSLVMRRREIPRIMVPVILNLGPNFGVDSSGRGDGAGMQGYGSFAAGLHDRFAVVESSGISYCIQFNLPPLSARRILGCSMADLGNRVVDLGDIIGARFIELMDKLQDARDWRSRFSLLDSFLAARLADAPEIRPDVAWAMGKLQRSAGAAVIGDLAAELGCSRKRLIALFRDQVGQTPKTVARILRFDRAVKLLGTGTAVGRAHLACDGGYYDQAHFNRDFRDFAGCTPGEYLARQMPDGGGTRDV